MKTEIEQVMPELNSIQNETVNAATQPASHHGRTGTGVPFCCFPFGL